MSVAGEAMPWGVPLAYGVAAILLMLALRASGRMAISLGLAGMALAAGTVVFTHNAASLPHLFGAIAAGGAAGVIIVRRTGRSISLRLVAGFYGLSGLAVVLTGWAIWLDPEALGLADPVVNSIEGWSRLSIGAATVLGAITTVGSLRAFLATDDVVGLAGLALLASCLGWSAAIFGLVLQNPTLSIAGSATGTFAAARGIAALSRRRLSP